MDERIWTSAGEYVALQWLHRKTCHLQYQRPERHGRCPIGLALWLASASQIFEDWLTRCEVTHSELFAGRLF